MAAKNSKARSEPQDPPATASTTVLRIGSLVGIQPPISITNCKRQHWRGDSVSHHRYAQAREILLLIVEDEAAQGQSRTNHRSLQPPGGLGNLK